MRWSSNAARARARVFPTPNTNTPAPVLADSHAAVFAKADLIVKVKEPLPSEFSLLRPGQILFTYLHLAANQPVMEALMRSGVTALAYETVEVNRRLPLLEPMSEIAGRMSVLVGGYFLAKHFGGSGVLLGGVPGVLPGKIVVLGGGTSGINAARMGQGLGADVTILEVDLERMRFLDITLHTAHTLYSNEMHLHELLPEVDLLIGAVLVPGARAPRLITREMLRCMRPGSVFVDIAIDQGGCAETSRPTTHHDPVFVEEGVTHYCVTNMPGALCPHRHPGAHQRDVPLHRGARGPRTGRSLPPASGTRQRHQCDGRETDSSSRRRSARDEVGKAEVELTGKSLRPSDRKWEIHQSTNRFLWGLECGEILQFCRNDRPAG